MEDLTAYLLPDVREPLREEQEDLLLTTLAALHARFWASPALDLPWLARASHHVGLLDPRCAKDRDALALLPPTLRDGVQRGWAAALRRLPPRVARALALPAEELVHRWADLPRTLVHGDAKVANFAILADRRVAAFDWALLGAAPPTVDIGWYLAVNATRLTRPKEDVMARYRALLGGRLATPIAEVLWDALVSAGVICGARMLLGSKAPALDADTREARAEWAWWVDHLERACA